MKKFKFEVYLYFCNGNKNGVKETKMIDLPIIIWYSFIGIAAIQTIFHWLVFSRLAFYKNKPIEKTDWPAVSVVICAKNEYTNLRHYLPTILEQDYPNYEVVVVNDDSTDETESLLKTLHIDYPHLKIVNLSNSIRFFKGKKFPLSMGIKSAKNEYLLLTDADCKPFNNQWIKEMVSGFSDSTEIVLGYGGYMEKKGLMNVFVRYESMRVAMQYMSFALWGMAYMGVGRNLAYKKSLFFKENGFISHYSISSGDDDLFINQASNPKNTRIVVGKESSTVSYPKTTLVSWFYQKKRHFTTSNKYKFKHKLLLGLWDLSTILFYPTFLIVMLLQVQLWISLGIFLFRLLSHFIITKKSMKIFGERKLLLLSPIFEIVLVFSYPIIYGTNYLVKKNKWK